MIRAAILGGPAGEPWRVCLSKLDAASAADPAAPVVSCWDAGSGAWVPGGAGSPLNLAPVVKDGRTFWERLIDVPVGPADVLIATFLSGPQFVVAVQPPGDGAAIPAITADAGG